MVRIQLHQIKATMWDIMIKANQAMVYGMIKMEK